MEGKKKKKGVAEPAIQYVGTCGTHYINLRADTTIQLFVPEEQFTIGKNEKKGKETPLLSLSFPKTSYFPSEQRFPEFFSFIT